MRRIPVLLLAWMGLLMTHCTPDPTTAIDTALAELTAAYPKAQVAVAVRDASTGLVYNHQADRVYHAASTMKVPVMFEVFRQAEAGRFSLTDSVLVRNEFRSIVDSSAYSLDLRDDADDQIYTHIGQSMTIRDLVYDMITVSSNLATNILIDRVGATAVQRTAQDLGTKHMKVLRGVEDIKAYRQGLSNTTTAADLAVLLQALMNKEVVSETADQEMIDVLLDQRFSEMIPAHLPEGTRVAHKTGQITAIHHDAGIVYPAEGGAPYVLVILIEGLNDDKDSAALGADIARAVHDVLR